MTEPIVESSEDTISQSKIITKAKKEMKAADYLVAFSGLSKSYCIGVVDMADSTKISANMHEREWCKYYEIFLNSMSNILQRFGGVAIKNTGDSLFFFFPESSNTHSKYGFISCLECALAMTESHNELGKIIEKEKLPSLNYRVSCDCGKVVIMKSSDSSNVDLIGPPVNMCFKINHKAKNNGIVIGGDLYQAVKDLDDYSFKSEPGFSIGLKYSYPVYSVRRNK